jgi:isopentenyl diphosphate isomerase/L-lactate dehydrogenase-like FMN-dependent dehydrogenase
MTHPPFAAYQDEIYTQGLSGSLPPFTTDPDALEESARQRMAPGPFWYVAGSTGAGSTARANREAFDHWRIVPRMLTNPKVKDLTTTVLGTAMPAPLMVAPVGVQSIIHPDGELATARAAAALGLTMILSSMATYSIEEVAQASGDGPRWFQLYWPNDPELALSFLDRAAKAGYTTLVVTLDTTSLAWRPHDVDNAYLPMKRGIGCAIPFSDPVFRAALARPPEEDLAGALAHWSKVYNNTTRSWEELAFLREHWDGPLLLKGIQHVDDARLAVEHGADGIVVSNHGGRQVDGAVGSLDMLAEITEAVGDDLTVLFDSGVRCGADIVKALALGARAVLIGRPYAYGLAHGGEAGVRHVLRGLLADLDLTLGLSGHRTVADLGRASLRPTRT